MSSSLLLHLLYKNGRELERLLIYGNPGERVQVVVRLMRIRQRSSLANVSERGPEERPVDGRGGRVP